MNAIVTTASGTVYRFNGDKCERSGVNACSYSRVHLAQCELGKPLKFFGMLDGATGASVIRITVSTPVVSIEPVKTSS